MKVGKSMELLDTPGILWPKLEGEHVGHYLAATGAIKDSLLDSWDITSFVLQFIIQHHPDGLRARFNLEQALQDPVEIIEVIGKNRGCLGAGGTVDYDKTCGLFLREFRAGKLGRITLEQLSALRES